MTLCKACFAFIAALTATVSAAAETHTIKWALPSSSSSVKKVSVATGDTVAFDIDSDDHDVWQFPDRDAYENCDFDMAKEIEGQESNGTVLVTANESGVTYYASTLGSDCTKGLKTTITVQDQSDSDEQGDAPTSSPTPAAKQESSVLMKKLKAAGIDPKDTEFSAASLPMWSEGRPSSIHVVDWYRPFTPMSELPKLAQVVVGDVIRFWIYDSQGDIVILPNQNAYMNCDVEGAIPLVEGKHQSYDFYPNKAGQLFFASRSFCLLGQKLSFMVDLPESLNIIPGGYVPIVNPNMLSQSQPTTTSTATPTDSDQSIVPTMKSFEESSTPPTDVSAPSESLPFISTSNSLQTSFSPTIQPTTLASTTIPATGTAVPPPTTTALASETIRVNWVKPSAVTAGLPDVTLATNSSLLFYYVNKGADTANVARFRSREELEGCDFSRAVVMNGQYGPYRLLFLSPGNFYFSSTIKDHCKRGLRQVVAVPRPNANAPVALMGIIYNDANRNQVADKGEGIANVPITYYSDVLAQQSTQTNVDGEYRVTGLAPGPYTVIIGDIPGFNFPPETNKQRSFQLQGGTTGTYNFRVLGPSVSAPATITGNIYNDINENENSDTGEGLEGVTVVLVNGDGELEQTAITDSQGLYTFTVAPGEYGVVIRAIAGFTLESMPIEKELTVPPGGHVSFNYSIVGPSNATEGIIQGIVYNDRNANNVPDNEEGVGGTPVTITNQIDGEITTVKTDSDGVFRTTVTPGNYNVSIGDIPGFPMPDRVDKSKLIEIHPGSTNHYNYAVTGLPANTLGTLSGNIYWDGNGNSLKDGEEGLANVNVTLEIGGEMVRQGITNATGGFLFTQLEPGTYTAKFSAIPDFTIDESNLVRPIGVGPGQNAVLDFAITGEEGSLDPNGYINGSVYHDFNDDMHADPDEGLGGINVTVVTIPEKSELQTTTTQADGSFTFTLPPGDYYVEIGELPGEETSLEQRTQLVTVSNGVTVPFNFRITGPSIDTPGNVTGTVYSDYNLNTEPDADEGLAGVNVEIFELPANELVSTTKTDGAGEFSIPVPPGAYRIKLGDFPGIDVPSSYRVKDVTVPPGGSGKFVFRLTGLPPPST